MSNRIRCLILDDDPSILEIASSAAQEAEFEFEIRESALGFKSQDLSGYDLVVLDLLMPGVDGIEFLRTLEAATPSPSVVLMSGMSGRTLTSARQLGLSKGLQIFDTVKKPFRSGDLVSVFNRFLESRRNSTKKPAQRRARPDLSKADLINAIARDEIVVHLQPQIKISSNEWVGVEALARWQHPQLGLLFPDSFISLAEEPDISGIFTAKILELSLDALNKLYSMTGFNGTVSVNFPASALADVGMTDRIIEAVDRHGIDHSRLIVEITETSVPQNVGNSMDIEMRLRMREIKLSIDDFGTGFSSLERLHASPFDELKVDLIFVRESQRDPAARSIVENSIRLGHSLEMQVVAEGVEDDAILTWLKGCGCDIAQGYHISKPLAVDDLCKWAANR